MSRVPLSLSLPLLLAFAAACSGTGTPAENDGGDVESSPTDDGRDPDAAAEDGADRDFPGDGFGDARDFSREDLVATDVSIPDATLLPPACGDGIEDPGEECDDGNRLNDDGCDWLCRIPLEPFEYPPPDPDMPPVEPTGPPVEVTEGAELTSGATFAVPDVSCPPIWLAASNGRFAVAYDYDQPYYGVRVRVLDRAGGAVGEPWDHETPWHLFSQALVPTADGFGLFSGYFSYGLLRTHVAADGTVPESPRMLRGPLDPAGGVLTGGAWSPGRWLAATWLGNGSDRDFRGWLFETFSDDGAPLRRVAVSRPPDGDAAGCVVVAPTAAGFVAGDGISVVVLDNELNPLSWSGTLAPFHQGACSLSAAGYWLAWPRYREGGVWPGDSDLVVAVLDLDGTPRFPPRTIVEASPRAHAGGWGCCGGDQPQLAVADGPAGAAIVYWEGLPDEETDGGPVMLVTVDDWGNVITPPTPVLAAGEITTIGWVLAIAADDLGYGVVTMVPGDVLGTASVVFRHFAPAP